MYRRMCVQKWLVKQLGQMLNPISGIAVEFNFSQLNSTHNITHKSLNPDGLAAIQRQTIQRNRGNQECKLMWPLHGVEADPVGGQEKDQMEEFS